MDNQGNAQLYTIGMRVFGTAALTVSTAPNTYVTRRAVKAWHDARVKMYKRAGISMKSLGYGRSLRPFLDAGHYEGIHGDLNGVDSVTEIDSENTISPNFTGDEWTYTRAAVSTPMDKDETGALNVEDLVDTYGFWLCGDSHLETTTTDPIGDESGTGTDQDSYVGVGMLKEWLGSFKKKVRAGASDVQNIKEDNPLVLLNSQQGSDKKEVLDLTNDAQDELRPWDLGGATHYSSTYAGLAYAVGNESSYIVFQAPCGLFNVQSYSEAAAQTVYTEFEVLDIRDM